MEELVMFYKVSPAPSKVREKELSMRVQTLGLCGELTLSLPGDWSVASDESAAVVPHPVAHEGPPDTFSPAEKGHSPKPNRHFLDTQKSCFWNGAPGSILGWVLFPAHRGKWELEEGRS